AGLRALQLVCGIGPSNAGRLMTRLGGADDPAEALAAFTPAALAAASWAEFAALFPTLRRPGSPWPGELADVERWYRPQLERLHEDAGPRAADVAHLVRLAAGYPSRERFLTELARGRCRASRPPGGVLPSGRALRAGAAAHPPRRDERRIGPARARRGLSD